MNKRFIEHTTGQAFVLTMGRSAIAYLTWYVTGDQWHVAEHNYPGWQPLIKRGLINSFDEVERGAPRVTRAGLLTFYLLQESGLIAKNLRPSENVIKEAA